MANIFDAMMASQKSEKAAAENQDGSKQGVNAHFPEMPNLFAGFLASHQPGQTAAENLDALEQRVNAQLNDAIQKHSVQSQQLSAATVRPPWAPPAPIEAYLAMVTNMQQWIVYYSSFDGAAEQLKAAGRPAFAERLKYVKDDSQRALGIVANMAQSAGAHQAQLYSIMSGAQTQMTDTILKANRDRQAVYDAANRKWGDNF